MPLNACCIALCTEYALLAEQARSHQSRSHRHSCHDEAQDERERDHGDIEGAVASASRLEEVEQDSGQPQGAKIGAAGDPQQCPQIPAPSGGMSAHAGQPLSTWCHCSLMSTPVSAPAYVADRLTCRPATSYKGSVRSGKMCNGPQVAGHLRAYWHLEHQILFLPSYHVIMRSGQIHVTMLETRVISALACHPPCQPRHRSSWSQSPAASASGQTGSRRSPHEQPNLHLAATQQATTAATRQKGQAVAHCLEATRSCC